MRTCYVIGSYDDIYRIEAITAKLSYGHVWVTNIDHPAPIERAAIEVLENLADGLYLWHPDQEAARAKDLQYQRERGEIA